MGLFYNASKPTQDNITEIFVQTEVSHSWRQLWANSIHQWRELCNSDPELGNTFTDEGKVISDRTNLPDLPSLIADRCPLYLAILRTDIR